MSKLVAVIMAGGAGTRFWPVSTERRPKQFLRLVGDRTLLQQSYDRIRPLVEPRDIFILTAEPFEDLCGEQLPEVPRDNIIGEPLRRDTAAPVALAALVAQARYQESAMVVLPSDQLITPAVEFEASIRSAFEAASDSPKALYTFGVRPSYPATGYGYLEVGEPLQLSRAAATTQRSTTQAGGTLRHFRLKQFREKPAADLAKAFFDAGTFFWNSGIFVWSTSAILAELRRQLPAHLDHLTGAAEALQKHGIAHKETRQLLKQAFDPLERISIDYGVMENAAEVRCVAASFTWSDVGGWLALANFLERTADGNVHRGALHEQDARDNIVFCEDETEHVALVGVEQLVVVRAGNKTLVMRRNLAEQVKDLVAALPGTLR